MMGHRDKLKTGDELDLASRVRRVLRFLHRPGVASRIKNAINRRARRDAGRKIAERSEDSPC